MPEFVVIDVETDQDGNTANPGQVPCLNAVLPVMFMFIFERDVCLHQNAEIRGEFYISH